MTKLTDKEKQLIIADYLDCQNYSEVARKYQRSVDTIRRIVLDDENNVVNKLKEKKEQNTKDIIEYMQEKRDDTQRLLNKLLRGMEIRADELDKFSDLKGLATAYGIIMDKQLKILELQRGIGNTEQLAKVQELLSKLEDEARQ